jgi:hypothetical protein
VLSPITVVCVRRLTGAACVAAPSDDVFVFVWSPARLSPITFTCSLVFVCAAAVPLLAFD